jgi:hypothetical protein
LGNLTSLDENVAGRGAVQQRGALSWWLVAVVVAVAPHSSPRSVLPSSTLPDYKIALALCIGDRSPREALNCQPAFEMVLYSWIRHSSTLLRPPEALWRPSSPRGLYMPFGPLYHQSVLYIAFFISLSLSITVSGVDLPVAFLQLPELALSDTRMDCFAPDRGRVQAHEHIPLFLITDRAPTLRDLTTSTKRLQPF